MRQQQKRKIPIIACNMPAYRCRQGMSWAVGLLLLTSTAVATQQTIAYRVPVAAAADSKNPEQIEYEIKAAFIYNFMRFIIWPEEKDADNRRFQKENDPDANDEKPPPLMIGVVGDNPFAKAFDPILDRRISDRAIVPVYLDGLGTYLKTAKTEAEAIQNYRKQYAALLARCDAFFICNSENGHLEKLLPMIVPNAAATISDIPDFALRGGMIEFVTDGKRVRFDINLDNVDKVKLNIRSQLLELARRIYRKQDNTR